MRPQQITSDSFLEIVTQKTSMIILGNGFSINFDANYSLSGLSSQLFATHLHLLQSSSFDVVSNQAYKTALESNYMAALDVLNDIQDEAAFLSLFSGAVDFATSIIRNKRVVDWINENDFNHALTFGLSPLHIVDAIVRQGRDYGALGVSYEYWTVLIYFYLVLKLLPSDLYSFDSKNHFIQAVELGSRFSILKEKINGINLYMEVSVNGVYTYLRFLLASNILLEGRSVSVTDLTNWNNLDIKKLSSFLSNFDTIATTNYDKLLETITRREVKHLHGSYSLDPMRVMSQSLGSFYNGNRYDISTIIIGDYFLSKSFIQVTSKSLSKQPQNSNIEIYTDILKNAIVQNRSEVVVIFGLSIDNDFHILRDVQINFADSKVAQPQIMYCYYSDTDKEKFIDAYNICITYPKDLSDFVRNDINVVLCDSKELIAKFFY